MKPALSQFPHISSYPVLLLAGFFFGWLLVRFRARRCGLRGADIDNLALLLPLAGLFGARLFARLFYEKAPWLEALQVWKGDGLVFYGGFIGGVLAVLIYGWLRRIRLLALADCFAPAVPLGLAFGRIGCFLAGCCWGDLCVDPSQLAVLRNPVIVEQVRTFPSFSPRDFPLAVRFPARSEAARQHVKLGLIPPNAAASLPVHPVQLYEAALALLLCLLLDRASRNAHPELVSLAMLSGYAWIRFCTEFFRADNKLNGAGLTFSQGVSLWIAAFCLLVLLLRAARNSIARKRGPAAAVPYTPHPASG